ncbi:MAG TPA: helix-turn-helix transcriptional regulator [Candidatus Limnocylindria bacterium]|nr:helix-turn-helix transcriptional regulator [Candidatus Limnocylindria bacterium]
MGRTTRPLFPRTDRTLVALGRRLRDARLRRNVSAEAMAARVGVSRPTLRRLENGDPAVNLATLSRVLTVLSLDSDLDLLAGNDEIGKRLQDLALPQRPRAPTRIGR